MRRMADALRKVIAHAVQAAGNATAAHDALLDNVATELAAGAGDEDHELLLFFSASTLLAMSEL